MSVGLIINNVDGDPIINTEDDNQYLWGDNYIKDGVTYYGKTTGINLSSGSADISSMLERTGVVFSGRNKLLFATVPPSTITPAGISNYTNGGFIGLRYPQWQSQKIITQGVSNHTMTLYQPNVMNNFTLAEQGYGLNVYDSEGDIMWSSNAQGHFDILAVGTWSPVGIYGSNGVAYSGGVVSSTDLSTDITLNNSLGPFYVLMNGTVLDLELPGIYRRCYEFRYPGVTSATITAGGSSYESAPTVSIAGGATGTAIISGGAVTAVSITNSGSYYASAPAITFSGGGGSGAAATAVLGTDFTMRLHNSLAATATEGQVDWGPNVGNGAFYAVGYYMIVRVRS